MDLRNLLKDSSLNNLQWLANPETLDPEVEATQDLDIKDSLEVEWGTTGDIGASEAAPVRAKKSSTPTVEDVVLATRVLLMSGRMGRSVVAALRRKFGDERLKKAVKLVRAALANEGVTGCVAVDPKGFKDCGDAWKLAQASPYRRLLKVILMKERCANCTFLGKTQRKHVQAGAPGDSSVDDFFTQTEQDEVSRPFCMRLNRPILSGQQDFDESEMDDTLIDLMTLGELDEDEVAAIKALKKNAYQKVRAAFLHIHNKRRQAERQKYAEKVDASEFKVEQDMAVDIDEAPKRPKVDVHISADKQALSMEDLGDLSQTSAQSVDVDFGMDERLTGVEVAAEQKDIDVEAGVFIEPEFEGTDIVALDEKEAPKKPLKVDPRSDLVIE